MSPEAEAFLARLAARRAAQTFTSPGVTGFGGLTEEESRDAAWRQHEQQEAARERDQRLDFGRNFNNGD